MKHAIFGLLLIVMAGILTNLVTLRNDEDRVAVENLDSYGNCLLPGIHGAANFIEDSDDSFCKFMVLPGGYDKSGKDCYLRTYQFSGSPEKERYRVRKRWFADEYQLQEVCIIYVRKHKFDYIASKMLNKGQPPLFETTIVPVKLSARQNTLRFSITLPNDSSPEKVHAVADKIEAAVNEYLTYFERPDKGRDIDVLLNRKPLPEKERFPFTIASSLGEIDWKFNGLDVLRNRDVDVLGMSPARRKSIFSSLILETSLLTDDYKDDSKTKRLRMVIERHRVLEEYPEPRILKAMNISIKQLIYVSQEADVLGWSSEIIDGVPESLQSAR